MFLVRRLMPAVAITLVLGACENDMMEPDNEPHRGRGGGAPQGVGALLAIPRSCRPCVGGQRRRGCPLGGQAKVLGAFTEEQQGDTARLGADFLITPTGCVVSGDGMQFILDADPALRYQLLIEIIGFFEEFNISGMITAV